MSKTKSQEGQLGFFRPDSEWTWSGELPDLTGRCVAWDTETRDDGLSRGLGSGWALGMTKVVGVSYASECGRSDYVPLAHPDTVCADRARVTEWLRYHFAACTSLVTHNGTYDYGSVLSDLKVQPPDAARMDDTQVRASLINENHFSYSLDNVAKRLGLEGKDEKLLNDALSSYGADPKRLKSGLYLLPARYVGPYATADAVQTLRAFERQKVEIQNQKLDNAYRLEMDVMLVTLRMRERGIRIDMAAIARERQQLMEQRNRLLSELGDRLNLQRSATMDEANSPDVLKRWFDAEGVQYGATPTGKPSFQSDVMEKQQHWLPQTIAHLRIYNDGVSKFMDTYLTGYAHRGRIHAEIHPLKSDEGGATTSRFSYSDPPLQQMPSTEKPRQKVIGQAIRRCFLPEKGETWTSCDYSQQEPRFTVHFAGEIGCPGADVAVRQYNKDPNTDYHTMVSEMTGIPRPKAKIINLGLTYGMGERKLADSLGLSFDDARALLDTYHARLPFIRPLTERCEKLAQERGYIRLIDGARRHFDLWEAASKPNGAGRASTMCSKEEAERRRADETHPWYRLRIRRAETRKAMNSLIQGSSARQTKRAVVECYRAGYLPLIQMHDELGFTLTNAKDARIVSEIMRDCVKLSVPMRVDCEVGRTWGDAKTPAEEYVW